MTPWTGCARKRAARVRCLRYLRNWCIRRRLSKSRVTSTAPEHETSIAIRLELGLATAGLGGRFRHRLRDVGRRTLAHRAQRSKPERTARRHAGDNEDTGDHPGNCRGLLRIIPARAIPSGLQLELRDLAENFALDATQAVAFGAGPSSMAGCSGARGNHCLRAMACARGSRSAGYCIRTGLSRCHDPFTGCHTNVDTLFAFGLYLAGTQPPCVARLADSWNHRGPGSGYLV